MKNESSRAGAIFMKRRAGEPELCHFYDGSTALPQRKENAGKFAVHRTEARRGSRAGSVELLYARNTFESSAQTAETKALHAPEQDFSVWPFRARDISVSL